MSSMLSDVIQGIHKRMVRCGGYLCVNRTIILCMLCIFITGVSQVLGTKQSTRFTLKIDVFMTVLLLPINHKHKDSTVVCGCKRTRSFHYSHSAWIDTFSYLSTAAKGIVRVRQS
jgi:hypothetical protein